MNKTSKIVLIFAIALGLFGCSDKDKETLSNLINPLGQYIHEASYQFSTDGTTVAEGSCNAVSVYPHALTDQSLTLFTGTTITSDLASQQAVARITGIPYQVGEEATLEGNNTSLSFVNIGSEKKIFVAVQGTIKRTADNSITFSGTGAYSQQPKATQTFSGHISSKAITLIKKYTEKQ